MTRPVRIGVLGCADIARRRTIPAIESVPGAQVIAVASRDGDKARALAERFGCEPVVGYEPLLERPDIDAVYLPLPAVLHAAWVESSLLAGKHVLVEKPIATTATSTAALLCLARERRLQLMENATFLHHSQHRRVAEMLASHEIGELRSFSSDFTIPPKPTHDIRYQRDIGGGALIDLGVYPIRAAVHYLGHGGLDVVGAALRVDQERDVVLSGDVLLATPAGVSAHLRFGMQNSYRASCEFVGSAGRILLDRAFAPPDEHRPVVRLERQDHREEFVLPADRQFVNAVQAFVAAVVDGDGLDLSNDVSLRQSRVMGQVIEKAVTAAAPAIGGHGG
jgi:dTDP-3,4-didehydro-2,6-dideoxy-alpha-D-glucose 3-reductase